MSHFFCRLFSEHGLNQGESTMKYSANVRTAPLEAAFAAAGEQGMSAFLREVFDKDPELKLRFITRFFNPGTSPAQDALWGELNGIVLGHTDGSFLIEWDESLEFEADYVDAISAHLDPVIQRGDADAAFSLLEVVVDHFGGLDVDESWSFSDSVALTCREYWSLAFALLQPEQVPARFAYLLSLPDELGKAEPERVHGKTMESDIEEFLVEEFADSPDYSHLVRDLAQANVASCEQWAAQERARNNGSSGFDWPGSPERQAARWTCVLLRAMRAAGEPVGEMMACAAPHIEDLNVALMVAGFLEEEGDAERVCTVLEKARGASDRPVLARREADSRLVRLFGELGRKDDERALLRELLITGDADASTDELLRAYRGCWSPEQWPAARDELLAEMEPGIRLYDCLAEEGLVEELMAMVRREGQFCLDRYEGFLVDAGQVDFVVECWCERGRAYLSTGTNREDYASGAYKLSRAARLPGGEGPARKVANEIRRENPRKSALKDELYRYGL